MVLDGVPDDVVVDLPDTDLILRLPINQGKGAALRLGFERLIADGFDAVITLDADGQHPPEFIPRFIALAEQSRADLVVGDRLSDMTGMPWDRRCSNRLSTFVMECIAFRKLHDVQCGFRWMRLSRWSELHVDGNRFDFEPQLILQGVWKKWRLAFVPIPTIYLHSDSSIHRIPDTIRFLRMIGVEVFRKLSGKYR